MTTMDPQIKKIIDEIFDPHISETPNGWHPNLPTPSQESLIHVATLINKDGREEDFQQFFSNNPTFLFREVPAYGDTNAGIITKLPIGNSFVCDFAVFVYGQGGCKITLVEIEKPSDQLFTQRLVPAKKLNNAIGQVTEWTEWITLNKQTFVRDSIDILKRAPIMNSPNEPFNSGCPIFEIWSVISIKATMAPIPENLMMLLDTFCSPVFFGAVFLIFLNVITTPAKESTIATINKIAIALIPKI